MSALTIGRLANAAGVGIDTVRFYERAGPLNKPRRTASGDVSPRHCRERGVRGSARHNPLRRSASDVSGQYQRDARSRHHEQHAAQRGGDEGAMTVAPRCKRDQAAARKYQSDRRQGSELP